MDMMQAMNTGHDGSMTTTHANTGRDAFSRLETMVMMASQSIPDRVIRQMLASAIQLVVHCARLTDGTRRVVSISEVLGVDGDQVAMEDIFVFEREGISAGGRVIGRFRGMRYKPECSARIRSYGFHVNDAIYEEIQEVRD
jgi:pilus assembly protein CpaF